MIQCLYVFVLSWFGMFYQETLFRFLVLEKQWETIKNYAEKQLL